MPRINLLKSTPIRRTPRVMQLEAVFDVPPAERSEVALSLDVPIEERQWAIGLVVGPSGCGKTTLARQLFGEAALAPFTWPDDLSIVDAFPEEMSIREITLLLSSVGFSSPPSWLRPFRALSNGEQFRASVARALAERPELTVIDEFTSVVDRTVARVSSAAVAKAVRRRRNQKLVAVGCHYDVIDWLCPDWVYDPAADDFQWRRERRRPGIALEITRVSGAAWRLFSRYHYLSASLSPVAKCYLACVAGRPAAFAAVLPFPHPIRPGWREHRTVCLPDYQGVGIGNALSEYVAGLYRATGKPYRSVTSNPAMIAHRARSSLWKMTRKPSMVRGARQGGFTNVNFRTSHGRITASFEFVGPAIFHDGFIA